MSVNRGSAAKCVWIISVIILNLIFAQSQLCWADGESILKVGAAAIEIKADDGMTIGGGIHPGWVSGQEGKLRASALVVQAGGKTVCLVSCDVLGMTRDHLDVTCRIIESRLGIPFGNVMVTSTHTHHAPSTVTIHGYQRDQEFCRRVTEAIVDAARQAHVRARSSGSCKLYFWLGEESSVGQNSRLLLSDGTIFWVGNREDAIRPTGPFDPELPILIFKRPDGALEALLFNHSTHNIGTLKPGKRSPGFYGLAAQEIERTHGGTVLFLPGAFGSTHSLSLPCKERVLRIKQSIEESFTFAKLQSIDKIASNKREFTYSIRHFDEAVEDEAVSRYCRKRVAEPESVIKVFRRIRQNLTSHQDEVRKTWLQVIRIGDIVIVGIPGELFTRLGQRIKRLSPFRYTYVVGVSNDYIGYIADAEAYQLGGYQVWAGFHSLVEKGTGEKLVGETVSMLYQLANREN
ncbi:MAG: hypothetical protein JSV03_10595 [Planctomycetota bacterium]|nr:MAG: hypothetical protein JSV03_10595 [Planctomycetota bacterium]